MDPDIFNIPSIGLKLKMDHKFVEHRTQRMIPKFWQIVSLLPLMLRYTFYSLKRWLTGLEPVMDFTFPIECKQNSGVPLGGIGGGTIGRGFRGEFCNFQMIPGMYEFNTVAANQFIVTIQDANKDTVYQKVLSCNGKPGRRLSSWDWSYNSSDGEYTALYPRSWSVFKIPEQNIKLICRQVSPVIPHNYKDSCVPACVFEWKVINNNPDTRFISITFTVKNGIGGKQDKKGDVCTSVYENSSAYGILMKQTIKENPCTYGIVSLKEDGVGVSGCTYFNPNGDGKEIWDKLKKSGCLNTYNSSEKDTHHGEVGCGLCSYTEVLSNSTSTIVFSLSWDMPKIKFPLKRRTHKRYYTKYFGDEGNAAFDIALYSLSNYKKWESEVYTWQKPILENMTLPIWYKSALLNELYYISDGGTVWLLTDPSEELPAGDPRLEYGRFAYLEGHEYRMYNTYDVHFYASYALTMLWPHLQTSLQYDFYDTIAMEDKTNVCFLSTGKCGYRKKKDTIPHDLGDPDQEPFCLINAYPIHDVSEWRDLNLKFVLQVFRDYCYHSDQKYMKHMFPGLVSIIERACSWDLDHDGMIENSGSADQTYDAWTMTGTSAYCGGLWIAALYCMTEMAKLLQQNTLAEKYYSLLTRSKEAYEKKLWNGLYYNFDCSTGPQSQSIMSDQLCGLWYLRTCMVSEEVFPNQNVQSVLDTIFRFNVKKHFDGNQGAVNGMMPDGTVDTFAIQSEEVWTGVTYALAALMIYEGKITEGFATAKGIYETVFEKSGLGFATPEALHGAYGYRSIGYMRPLCIWSMQAVIEEKPKFVSYDETAE